MLWWGGFLDKNILNYLLHKLEITFPLHIFDNTVAYQVLVFHIQDNLYEHKTHSSTYHINHTELTHPHF